ncbi:transposase IS4 domain-containing protein [Pochonia chlamydosporia 170]|uniref:Transposase IS4 domain-containing protein n=1 Tax=Pochonia chlamydosporia 170 TaxID=1380566 RepID=A0A219ANK3_METCM|nr:transposase IS4 domain-containing protein [Pochonia chlamydosporia 170]OWT42333.1 transposase IS4 domain-containing protein [Pochonia chlamydosporia 170]
MISFILNDPGSFTALKLPGHIEGPRTKHCRQHAWKPTYAAEIYLFFGMLIYMSIHLEPHFKHYWSTAPTSPVHPIARFMSRNRFQLLYRLFCVWDSMDPPRGVFNRIHNWSTHLQETSTQYWKPESEVSVDEAMVRYTGKSTETVHIPSKPIPIGYKVWVVADSGYILRWSFHAKGSGIVIDLLSRLPAPPSTSHGYHCFMDNLFSTPELFELLRGQGTAATGTARLGRIDSRKMAQLKAEDRSKDFVAWVTLYVRKHKTKEVMQFAFKDNALVLAMSTRFTGWEPSIWRLRRQPGKTSTSAKTARVPFEGEPTKMLQIPRLIDEYNHHMNGVDNGDQLRADFESPRRIQRGGHQYQSYFSPLFNNRPDVAVTNSFLLQREGWPKTSKLRCKDQTAFRLALCKELLLQYGKQVALHNSGVPCIPEAMPTQNAGEIHSKVHRAKRGWCACCSSKRQNYVLGRAHALRSKRMFTMRRATLRGKPGLAQKSLEERNKKPSNHAPTATNCLGTWDCLMVEWVVERNLCF